MDEATDYKNLFMPAERGGESVKYMGSPGPGSKRAWAFDFRCMTVHERTGGTGVILLSATPAKNSPIEFFNLIQYIDPRAWDRLGITDPERFIDRYIDIEYKDTLDPKLELKTRPVVVGFKNLGELRDVVFKYSEYKTTDDPDVEIKLPTARKKTVSLTMDARQEDKTARMIDQIADVLKESARDPSKRMAILGMEQRLNSVALHGQLDDGYTWHSALKGGVERRKVPEKSTKAWTRRGWHVVKEQDDKVVVEKELPPPDPRSPKISRIAEVVAENQHCGHIIFCQSTAPHRWMKQVLVDEGLPENRIAILNAIVTKPADRQRIAKAFNGNPALGIKPEYDVVIANSVAYEGINLQTRTCFIHHLDLPHTPMDLVQRNGRGLRQGNTLAVLEIHYYLSEASTDALRYGRIIGKATWISEFYSSTKTKLSNPQDDEISPDEMLIKLSRNPAKTRGIIEERRKQAERAKRDRIARNAARKLQLASNKFKDVRRLRVTNPKRAAEIEAEAEELLSDLQQTREDAWPWARWIERVRETEYLVPDDGGAPLYEGLRITKKDPFGRVTAIEFGRILYNEAKNEFEIGGRLAGRGEWQRFGAGGGELLTPNDMPGASKIAWPENDDEQTRRAIEQKLKSWQVASVTGWTRVGWVGASDEFIEKWWPPFRAQILKAFERSNLPVPMMVDGKLAIRKGAAVVDGEPLPPTLEGWRTFQRLAPGAKIPMDDRKEVAKTWWLRDYKRPQKLPAPAKPTAAAKPATQATGVSKTPATAPTVPPPIQPAAMSDEAILASIPGLLAEIRREGTRVRA